MHFSTLLRIKQLTAPQSLIAWREHESIRRQMLACVTKGDVDAIAQTCLYEWRFFEAQDLIAMTLDNELNTPAHIALLRWHNSPAKLEEILRTLQRIHCEDIKSDRPRKFVKEMLHESLIERKNRNGAAVVDLSQSIGTLAFQACIQSWPQEWAAVEDSIAEAADDHFDWMHQQAAEDERLTLKRGLPKRTQKSKTKRL